MRVLVTGGAGFVGRHVAEALLDGGHEVVVVDALLAAAHRTQPDDLDVRAAYRWHDLRDEDALADAVRGCDAVSHQAAMVGLGVDFDDVTAYVAHNDGATAALLRVLHGVRFRGPLVLAGSMVVYGEGGYECARHGSVRPAERDAARLAVCDYEPRCPRCDRRVRPVPVGEDAPLAPRTVYAATKLHQEHLCRAFEVEHPDVAVTALRYHNVYGAHMPRDTPYAGVASIFRSALERGEPPMVLEDGGQLRDFVHVRDVARANVAALTHPEPVRGALNVASGHPRRVLDLASALSDAFGPDAPRPHVTGGYRPGDVRHVFASTERIRAALGFVAEMPFEAGVRDFASAPLRAG